MKPISVMTLLTLFSLRLSAQTPGPFGQPPAGINVGFEEADNTNTIIRTPNKNNTADVTLTIENKSNEVLHLVGVGQAPTMLTPDDKDVKPGGKTEVKVRVAMHMAPTPIPIGYGAAFRLGEHSTTHFISKRVRVATPNDIITSSDEVLWRGNEDQTKVITLKIPNGVTLKGVKTHGEFTANLENGVIHVTPKTKASDREYGLAGNIELITDPDQHPRPIRLVAHPKSAFSSITIKPNI